MNLSKVKNKRGGRVAKAQKYDAKTVKVDYKDNDALATLKECQNGCLTSTSIPENPVKESHVQSADNAYSTRRDVVGNQHKLNALAMVPQVLLDPDDTRFGLAKDDVDSDDPHPLTVEAPSSQPSHDRSTVTPKSDDGMGIPRGKARVGFGQPDTVSERVSDCPSVGNGTPKSGTASSRGEASIAVKPIVRPPFPKLVRDRSPIVGVSSGDSLRVCFRVGEALNVGSQAVRTNSNVLLELYAKVHSSHRDPRTMQQHFIFTDLWAQNGPSLQGVSDLTKSIGIQDSDSKALLSVSDGSKMCRCIGRMRRDDQQWKLSVLNIWEADWDDVEYVRGVIAS